MPTFWLCCVVHLIVHLVTLLNIMGIEKCYGCKQFKARTVFSFAFLQHQVQWDYDPDLGL